MNYARYATIHARHLPDKVCLIERTPSKNLRRTLTWKQFNDEINRTANYLSKELGVKDGDFVMHLQNNSLEWLITYYGIIKLGAVVVPLNFRFAGPDILYAADVCSPKVFILGSEFLPVVQPVQKELKTIQKYICVGDQVPGDMIDYKTIAAYKDTSEALVDVDGPARPGHDVHLRHHRQTQGGAAHPLLAEQHRHRERDELLRREERQLRLLPAPLSQRHHVPVGALLRDRGDRDPPPGVHGAQVDPGGACGGKGDGHPLRGPRGRGDSQCPEERPAQAFGL